MTPQELKNAYYILRHGQSLANIRDLIISHPENGIDDFGLSDAGREQVYGAFSRYPDAKDLNRDTLIHSSDFLRARHTARIAAEVLDCSAGITYTPCFGNGFSAPGRRPEAKTMNGSGRTMRNRRQILQPVWSRSPGSWTGGLPA